MEEISARLLELSLTFMAPLMDSGRAGLDNRIRSEMVIDRKKCSLREIEKKKKNRKIRADILVKHIFIAFESKIYTGTTLFYTFDACVENCVKIQRTFIANITS